MSDQIIPARLHDEFIGFMQGHEDDDASDARWFSMLEHAASKFIRANGLRVDANAAAHYYLKQQWGAR